MIELLKRKPRTYPKSYQLNPHKTYLLFEVRGENEYASVAVIVSAIDGEEAYRMAKEASSTLFNGKISQVEGFIGATSICKGVLAKYEWRKNDQIGGSNEVLERKAL